jgi:glycosidase
VGTETSVELRGDFRADGWTSGVAMIKSGSQWTANVNVPYNKQVQYKFFTNGTTWTIDPAQPTVTDASSSTNNVRAPVQCASPVCVDPGAVAAGVYDWRDAVIYFVFVDRFFDGNSANNCDVDGVSSSMVNYAGGDWAGLKKKIDDSYFSDLGVNTLWITVPADNTDEKGKGAGQDNFYYSAFHGYWPKNLDPKNPESCFGSAADLKALIASAHGKGIKVLFDYAMVHLHKSAQVFTQNPSWFWPQYDGTRNCICGQGCDWNADGKRCWFTDYLPHWDYTNANARAYSVQNVIDWVTEYGIDGLRLDAIKHVDDRWLTDLRGRLTTDVVAKQSPQQRFYLVGETFSYSQSDLKYYVDPSSKLDGQFDFPERLALIKSVLMRKSDMSELATFLDQNDSAYGAGAVMSPFVGNHDLGRVIHMAEDAPAWDEWSNNDKARSWSSQPVQPTQASAYERLANAYAVLLTNRGAPLLYYGDEVGLAGAGDPDNRRMMPWTGLSTNQTFLRDRVSALLKIRAGHLATRRGERVTLSVNAGTWLYKLSVPGDEVYVAINRGDTAATVSGLPSGSYSELLTGTAATGGTGVSVPARQSRVFVPK